VANRRILLTLLAEHAHSRGLVIGQKNVLVVEYTADGLRKACTTFGGRLSVVLRDREVTAPGSPAYICRTC
jgi:hypothetical protein